MGIQLRTVYTEQFDPDLTGSAASALAIESRVIWIELDPPLVVVSNQFDRCGQAFRPGAHIGCGPFHPLG